MFPICLHLCHSLSLHQCSSVIIFIFTYPSLYLFFQTSQETRPRETSNVNSTDAEKVKLAEQLFTNNQQGDNFRMENAGFKGRRKNEKISKATDQTVKKDELQERIQVSALLLDIDSGVGDNSGPEQIENLENKFESNETALDSRGNESLLAGIIMDSTAAEMSISEEENGPIEKEISNELLLMTDFESVDVPRTEAEQVSNEVSSFVVSLLFIFIVTDKHFKSIDLFV